MKKSQLFAFASAICISSLFSTKAEAVTIDQLVAKGGQAVQITKLPALASTMAAKSSGTKLAKVSDTKILLSGLYLGQLNFEFELVNNQDQVVTDGTRLRISSSTTSSTGYKVRKATRNGTRYTISNNDRYAYFDIGMNENGNYTLISSSPIYFQNGNAAITNAYTFEEIAMEIIPINGICTHRLDLYTYSYVTFGGYIQLRSINQQSNQEFGVIVEFDRDNGTFKILNLGHAGYAVDRSLNKNWFTGTFSAEKGTIQLDPYQYCWNSDIWNSTFSQFNYLDYFYLASFTNRNGRLVCGNPEVGTFSEEENLHHNDEPINWVTNDGNKKTYLSDWTITLPSYTYYTDFSQYYYMEDFRGRSFNDTRIEGSEECTLDVDLKIDEFRFNKRENFSADDDRRIALAVQLSSITNKNDMYLDNYEIYLIKGLHSSIYEAGLTYHEDDGLVGALKISDVNVGRTWYPETAKAAISTKSDSNEAYLRKAFSDADLGDNYSDNGHYTFFIKANYTAESGLEPTFHSMQYTVIDQTTEVENITTDIFTEDAEPVYFNLQGVEMSEPLAPGVYVKRVGNTTSKVIVK